MEMSVELRAWVKPCEKSYALQRHLRTGDALIARGRSHSCGGWNRYQMCHQKRQKTPLIGTNVVSIDHPNGVDKGLHGVCGCEEFPELRLIRIAARLGIGTSERVRI